MHYKTTTKTHDQLIYTNLISLKDILKSMNTISLKSFSGYCNVQQVRPYKHVYLVLIKNVINGTSAEFPIVINTRV